MGLNSGGSRRRRRRRKKWQRTRPRRKKKERRNGRGAVAARICIDSIQKCEHGLAALEEVLCVAERAVDGQRKEERRQRVALFDPFALRDPVVCPAFVRPRVVALAAVPEPDEGKHGAQLRIGTELGKESATVHMVIRPDAVER